MAKCEICSTKVDKIFLDKILGTYVKDGKGKRHIICSNCQRNLSLDEIRSKLPL